ncbi:MAG TPA: methyltransferase [Pyrinomonadaceae bacterium]
METKLNRESRLSGDDTNPGREVDLLSGKVDFDGYADEYDAHLGQAISVSGEDKDYFARGRIDWLSKYLKRELIGVESVLDFGCGTGGSTPHLLELLGAGLVLGLDVSSKSLDVARRLHGEDRARFMLFGEYRPAQEVDLAVANNVFHHIAPAERRDSVQYIFDSLRPGGLLAFWENNPWNPATRYVMSRCEFDQDAVTLTFPEARGLLRGGGFEVIRTDFLFIFPRALRHLRWIEPHVARLPLGTQYLVLCRKPQN